jgi:DNA-directed RNA polymerase subunit K
MGAPTILKIPKEIISPIDIAMHEFNEGAIPITVKRLETT